MAFGIEGGTRVPPLCFWPRPNIFPGIMALRGRFRAVDRPAEPL